MKPIKSREGITARQVQSICDALGPTACLVVGLNDIDLSAGAGVINDYTKCIWTKDGARIDIWARDGSIGAAKHDSNS